MEKITKEISLYNISDLQETAEQLNSNEPDTIRANLRVLWNAYKETVPEDHWPRNMRQWIQIKDEKPKARCGYFSVNIPIKGWNYDEEVQVYSIDITEAICKLTGDTYRKDGTIKVGSSSAQGWSFSGHLEDRIMRSL
jgi:hypothetical protein